MFAMKDMFRWMSAGCLTLCLAVPAFAQNQQFQDKANKAPVNGRVYAQQQAVKKDGEADELIAKTPTKIDMQIKTEISFFKINHPLEKSLQKL